MTQPETVSRHRPSLHLRSDNDPPHPANSNNAAPVRRGVLGTFLDALHDSRRQQAFYAIHRYRRLIAAPRSLNADITPTAGTVFEQTKGRINMTTSDDAAGLVQERSTRVRTPHVLTWTLIAICVIGFGILHIAGGAIINGAVKPTAEMPPVVLHGD
jgi:hypothetical protein